jgi:hypothetical protein
MEKGQKRKKERKKGYKRSCKSQQSFDKAVKTVLIMKAVPPDIFHIL